MGGALNPQPLPPEKQGEQLETPPKKAAQLFDNQARLVVALPANAKLYVDDNLTKSTSSRRSFVTPELQPGQSYFYVLRAEVDRDGKTVAQSKKVTVRAGQTVETSFLDMGTEATTRVAVGSDR
jgi:uncharacterized protein (TIGR03000 family)